MWPVRTRLQVRAKSARANFIQEGNEQAGSEIRHCRRFREDNYLLHGLEQGLSVVLESHDELQLGATRFHGCVAGGGEGRRKNNNRALKCLIDIWSWHIDTHAIVNMSGAPMLRHLQLCLLNWPKSNLVVIRRWSLCVCLFKQCAPVAFFSPLILLVLIKGLSMRFTLPNPRSPFIFFG